MTVPQGPSSLLPVCILAGGLGTRLGQAVADTPKPLLEVAGAPFLRHQLRLLKAHGARRVVLCVGYLGERIEAALGDGANKGLELRYVYDGPDLRGTAGAIRGGLDQLGDTFMVSTAARTCVSTTRRCRRGSPRRVCPRS